MFAEKGSEAMYSHILPNSVDSFIPSVVVIEGKNIGRHLQRVSQKFSHCDWFWADRRRIFHDLATSFTGI